MKRSPKQRAQAYAAYHWTDTGASAIRAALVAAWLAGYRSGRQPGRTRRDTRPTTAVELPDDSKPTEDT